MAIWDPDFIGYYMKLSESIGEYTVYNILGELGITPRISDMYRIPFFKLYNNPAVKIAVKIAAVLIVFLFLSPFHQLITHGHRQRPILTQASVKCFHTSELLRHSFAQQTGRS